MPQSEPQAGTIAILSPVLWLGFQASGGLKVKALSELLDL